MTRLAVAALLVLCTACAGSHATGSASASGSADCAFRARYHGHTYSGTGVAIAARPGPSAGVAVLPACNDTGGTAAPPSERIRVAQLPGAPVSEALVWPGHPDMVIVRDPVHPPAAVRRLMRAPVCRAGDAPIDLTGPWLGILSANGRTETDMRPPYDLSLLVRRASNDRYDRAFLAVRVPRSLGRPLTEHDVRTSLWKGGILSAAVRCHRGAYVATAVTASPPS